MVQSDNHKFAVDDCRVYRQ